MYDRQFIIYNHIAYPTLGFLGKALFPVPASHFICWIWILLIAKVLLGVNQAERHVASLQRSAGTALFCFCRKRFVFVACACLHLCKCVFFHPHICKQRNCFGNNRLISVVFLEVSCFWLFCGSYSLCSLWKQIRHDDDDIHVSSMINIVLLCDSCVYGEQIILTLLSDDLDFQEYHVHSISVPVYICFTELKIFLSSSSRSQ